MVTSAQAMERVEESLKKADEKKMVRAHSLTLEFLIPPSLRSIKEKKKDQVDVIIEEIMTQLISNLSEENGFISVLEFGLNPEISSEFKVRLKSWAKLYKYYYGFVFRQTGNTNDKEYYAIGISPFKRGLKKAMKKCIPNKKNRLALDIGNRYFSYFWGLLAGFGLGSFIYGIALLSVIVSFIGAIVGGLAVILGFISIYEPLNK